MEKGRRSGIAARVYAKLRLRKWEVGKDTTIYEKIKTFAAFEAEKMQTGSKA